MLEKLEEELTLIPNITIVEVDQTLAREAGRIRRQYKFMLPDSIQLATALDAKVDVFVTNDKKLGRGSHLSPFHAKKDIISVIIIIKHTKII